VQRLAFLDAVRLTFGRPLRRKSTVAPEIFRFFTIRPPQEVDPAVASGDAVDLNPPASDFLQLLVNQNQAGSANEMRRTVEQFRRSDNPGYIDSRDKVDPRFMTFYTALASLSDPGFRSAATDSFQRTFDTDPKTFINQGRFTGLYGKVADSIVAAAIDASIPVGVRTLLVSLAKTLGLIKRLAAIPPNQVYSKTDFVNQVIILPQGILPLPLSGQDVSQMLQDERDRRDKIAKNKTFLLDQAQTLAATRNAIRDLLAVFEKSIPQPPPPAGHVGFVLSSADVSRLKDETKGILQENGFDLADVDVPLAVSLLEQEALELANLVYSSRSSMKYLVGIGDALVPSDLVLGDMPTNVGDGGDVPGFPGACPPAPSGDVNDTVTVPDEKEHGEARILGIADLMIVEQELLRYDMGEIAHIENVLKSEVRNRRFTTRTTTEQATLTETETIEEKTKDLTSTERFELQTESEQVINENSSVAAGITINASYGPSVDVTSNFNASTSTAKQESTRASTTFARETTSRATSRIQNRTLQRQFTRTVTEIEEINRHGFDNKDGTENITGVYRFVDKVYYAQVVSYGKRLMLEFVVPEPAAFFRYARTKQPLGAVTQIQPEAPGYCQDGNFVPLLPQHIDADNYLYWAGKYSAEDIEPPPSAVQIVSASKVLADPPKKSDVTEDYYGTFALDNPGLPDGYKPVMADISVNGWNVAKEPDFPHHISLQVQQQIVFDQTMTSLKLVDAEANEVPVSLVIKNYENLSVVANICCLLTLGRYQQWQIKVFNSIMNAYNDLKSRFDNAIATARIQAADNLISGTNPAANRETEKGELKRGCISLLTAQNYDTFDSVKRNAAPYGYPEIAFADAEAEGRYIQFFENAFEWTNMLYIFYPYFWGTKADWVTVSQLTDDDPLFTRFLQAGAARVQVPVRPGFENSMLLYMSGGGIWAGPTDVVNCQEGTPDCLILSILTELKEQLGNQSIEGTGRLAVTKDNVQVTGTGTEFTANDENKRIIIHGRTYVIARVADPTHIQLSQNYPNATESDVRYSLGAKLVGEPWEVKLPTDLVMIDEHKTLAEINATITQT
jgi:hypothetical protein